MLIKPPVRHRAFLPCFFLALLYNFSLSDIYGHKRYDVYHEYSVSPRGTENARLPLHVSKIPKRSNNSFKGMTGRHVDQKKGITRFNSDRIADKRRKRKKKTFACKTAKGPAYGFDGFFARPPKESGDTTLGHSAKPTRGGRSTVQKKRLMDFGYSGKTESSEKPSFARENQLDFWTECHGWKKKKSGVGYIFYKGPGTPPRPSMRHAKRV
ncbi:hypothetical protein J3E69DRAFT_330950 [Trichoderma sp. SZMC 28015]